MIPFVLAVLMSLRWIGPPEQPNYPVTNWQVRINATPAATFAKPIVTVEVPPTPTGSPPPTPTGSPLPLSLPIQHATVGGVSAVLGDLIDLAACLDPWVRPDNCSDPSNQKALAQDMIPTDTPGAATATPSNSPSATPTDSPTNTPSATATPSSSATSTATPTASRTRTASITPTRTPLAVVDVNVVVQSAVPITLRLHGNVVYVLPTFTATPTKTPTP